MKKIAVLAATPLLFSGWVTALAEEDDESPYVTPVDTFTCSYNDGQDRDDLDEVIADWNDYMDDQGADGYGAFVVTPRYYGKDTFEVGWLGYWTSQEVMGAGIDNYLASGTEIAARFAEVLTCQTHEHWATVQIKAPPEGGPPDNVVFMFSNCTKNSDTEWDTLFDAIDEATAYWTEQGSKSGDWAMWPVFGGGDDPEWHFKWVTTFANYTEFGKAYQVHANGGGRQKMNEIYGDMLKCDTARVYDAKTVRRVTAEESAE